MKFCSNHWTELKAAISEKGLDDLIAKNGEEAAKRMVSELDGGVSRSNFDPLMAAHNAIVSNAIESAGLQILAQEGCPLCLLIEHCQCAAKGTPDCAFAKWIGFAARDAYEEAKRLGLVGAS